jgi:uncharacterized protein (TIGR02118 family)
MIKLTVLYGHPTDTDAFERYYATTHMPLVGKIQGVRRTERAKVVGTPDGSQPAYHRIFEFWFDDQPQMQQVLGSAEAQAAVADLGNFATGGVTILIAQVEDSA